MGLLVLPDSSKLSCSRAHREPAARSSSAVYPALCNTDSRIVCLVSCVCVCPTVASTQQVKQADLCTPTLGCISFGVHIDDVSNMHATPVLHLNQCPAAHDSA